jgi:DNA-binding LacI/PurR family transcriptional regulator
MSNASLDSVLTPRVTVKDLARDLGMSVSTVSRAFYDDAVIAAETRERVLRRAAEIGYQPNPLARGLITRSSRIVGLVVSDIANPFYPEVMTRMTERLQMAGLNVMLVVVSPISSEEDSVRVLLSYHPDVVVMLATTLSSAAAASCRRVGTPVVFFNRSGSDSNSYAVTCDNENGARLVADYLIDRGHTRLGFVAGRADASTSIDRWNGFHMRCLERGVPAPVCTDAVGFSYEAGYTAAHKLLGGGDRPTALFCANDILAIGAMDAARRDLGLSVPEDVSIVGFDDIGMASWPSHALTTVRQPIDLMIDRTTTLALDLARNEPCTPDVQRLPGQLIERNTTRSLL